METGRPEERKLDGNTIDPTPTIKRPNQLKEWFFTWNNYPGDWETILRPIINLCTKCSMQPEIGANSTPHIQGCLTLKKAARWSELGLPATIHWEATRNSAAAAAYCAKVASKAGPTISKGPRDLRLITILLPWQEKCLLICDSEPDFRTVHWIWEDTGNVGKSQFSRLLCSRGKTLVVRGGSCTDLMFIVMSHKDLSEITTVVWDLPRENEGRVSWNAIEQLKDGLITSTKYESGCLLLPPMNVVIFSNYLPRDAHQISGDRLKILKIVGQDLVAE